MSVGAYPGANSYTGNAIAVQFAYSYEILDDDDLRVTIDDVVKALGADYAVSGVGNPGGGNVTFGVAPGSGTKVVISRLRPYLRANDYQRNGAFEEATVDDDFDSLVMQVQQLAADLKRAFKGPLSVVLDQVFSEAAWAARHGKFLAMDAGGNLVLSTGGLSGVAVESVIQVLDSIAALKALSAPAGAVTYLVRGFAAAGDGGGGFYFWKAADVTADDGGTVIQLDAGGNGRFNRLF